MCTSGERSPLGVVGMAIGVVGWWASDIAAVLPIAAAGAFALAAAVTDARTRRIPNGLVLEALTVLTGSWPVVAGADNRPMAPLIGDLGAGLLLSGAPVLFVVWVVAPRVVGGGDWKLLAVLGIAVGYAAPLGATVIVLAASVAGVAVALAGRRRVIALGPALAFGYVVAVGAAVASPDGFGNWYR